MSFRTRLLVLALQASLASAAVACTASNDDVGTNDNAITGSLANAKACAVQSGYEAAGLDAFTHLAKATLPAVIQSAAAADAFAYARFVAGNIGAVYVIEDPAGISFFDGNAMLLARATRRGTESFDWSSAAGPARCDGASPGADGGVVTVPGDAGAVPPPDGGPSASDSGTVVVPDTCLSTDPIDATAFPYVKSKAATPGACTAQELTKLSAYYKDHGSEDTFTTTGWGWSVSTQCASCVFSESSAAAWGPIVVENNQLKDVNRGGCVEVVSGSEACGRAYQQYQACTVQACLVKCQTQSEFTACRQDATVLTTACKVALDTVRSACGGNIGQYETACKGTSYTFEGPVKKLCVGP